MDINTNEVMTGVATNLIEDSIKGAWKKVNKELYEYVWCDKI